MKKWILISIGLLLSACVNRLQGVAPVEEAWQQSNTIQGGLRVERGDSLYAIAWRYGHDYRELAAINHLSPPYRLHEGQILYLAPTDDTAIQIETARRGFAVKQPPQSVVVPPLVSAEKEARPVSRWRWPTNGEVTTYFGSESKGIDMSGRRGQPIRAVAAGHVVYSGEGLPGYGKLLIVKHNYEYLSAYAHNDALLVKEGEAINAGEKIALMGSTGSSHVKLHFELRHAGIPVNPVNYFSKPIKKIQTVVPTVN